MPITALPPNAVRAIGSSQALSDSASVVKELIDNAIDGRATNISIELSPNTLDDIRVKDNGHGIAPDDRVMICIKYCTSKIRDLHDLENVGGRSLGFRGEALASAAEMSGSLTINTRIDGEGTAVELNFDRNGQILGERRTSHPVGTTVKVGKFLQNLPVRRQATEKAAVKMLAKIKRMLQAYALARPHLRLSLKILKAKDRKGDWTYPKSGALSASRSEASLHAATDVFGKKLTSQCKLTVSSWSSTGEQIDEVASKHSETDAGIDEKYTLEAIVAKPDCDGSVLRNVGQYLSIDSRPVSCTRGTLKQIISLYKSHLRSAAFSENNEKIVDPFLCLNIACPPGSYDANVEPAKDDVLFTNSELLLGIVEKWCRNIYGEIQPSTSKPSIKEISALEPRGIRLLLARSKVPVEAAPVGNLPVAGPRIAAHAQLSSSPLTTSALTSSAAAPPGQNSGEIDSTTESSATAITQAEATSGSLPSRVSSAPISTDGNDFEPSSDARHVERKLGWKGSMYAEDEYEEVDLQNDVQGAPRSPVDLGLDDDEHLQDVNVSNPWAIAKFNAAMRPSGRNKQLHTPGRQVGDAGHSPDSSPDDLPRQGDPQLLENSSPRIHPARFSPDGSNGTSNSFPFPQRARGKRKANDAGVDASLTPAPSNKERHKRGALDSWVQKKSLGGYDELDDSPGTLQEDQGPPDLPYTRDFVSARSLPAGGTPLDEIQDASRQPRRKPEPRKKQQDGINKPFIPPVHDPSRVWFDIGGNSSQKPPRKHRPNNNHRDTAAAPTLTLRDDEIEDDESATSTSTTHPPPPMHPDLAITLDYEARKQKAIEAHRKVTREQAAAASQSQADLTNPHHPPPTTSSPHKNRQAKAIAALHPSSSPPPAPPSLPALRPSDPRAYLLRIHQHEKDTPESQKGKPRRHKTSMLPLETVSAETYTGDLTLLIEDVQIGDVDEDMQESGAWDRYVRSGVAGEAFAAVDGGERERWEGKLKRLVRETYAVEGGDGEDEGEGGPASLAVDLSAILQAHVAAYA